MRYLNYINLFGGRAKVAGDTFAHTQSTTIRHASEPTNQQIMFTINRSSGTSSGTTIYVGTDCKDDYSDIRFYLDDVVQDYWIEPGYTSSSANIWVKFTQITSSNKTLDIKYGNASMSSASDGDDTFAFFDGFTGSSLDTAKWDSTGTPSVGSGILSLVDTESITSKDTYGQDTVIRARVKSYHFNSEAYYEYLGFSGTSWILAIYSYDGVGNDHTGAYRSYKNGYLFSDMIGVSAETWFIQTIERKAATHVIFRVNDANEVTLTNDADKIPTGSLPVHALVTNTGAQLDVDWIFVYKYLATAPTIGEWT